MRLLPPLAVISAKAGLRRQDAEANIRVANGPKGVLQERRFTHAGNFSEEQCPQARAIRAWVPAFAGMTIQEVIAP